MKIIPYLILSVLLVSIVSAFPAGNPFIIDNFDKCDSLRVNVTATSHINDSEYWLIDCDETKNNSWYCDCEDNYDLIINTDVRTINNYTFNIAHNYSNIIKESTSSSSSGSYMKKVSEESKTFYVYKSKSRFMLNKEIHNIWLMGMLNDKATIEIESDPISITLREGEKEIIQLDGEDIEVEMLTVSKRYAKVSMKIVDIKEDSEPEVNQEEETEIIEINNETKEKNTNKTTKINRSTNKTTENTTRVTNSKEEDKPYTLYISLGLAVLVLLYIGFVEYKKWRMRKNEPKCGKDDRISERRKETY